MGRSPPEATFSTRVSPLLPTVKTETSSLPALTANRNLLPSLRIKAPCEARGSVGGSPGCATGSPRPPVENVPAGVSVPSGARLKAATALTAWLVITNTAPAFRLSAEVAAGPSAAATAASRTHAAATLLALLIIFLYSSRSLAVRLDRLLHDGGADAPPYSRGRNISPR